jgi:mono/diheme cytochrome c family protein
MNTRVLSIALAAWLHCGTANADQSTDQQAFVARCAKCHGETGTGTFMLARRYGKDQSMLERRSNLAPEFIRHVVRNGIVSMPAITRVEVTDEELDAIVRYLTRKKDSTASASKP